MKIDNTLLVSWKIYFFFNKRGGDDIYNDEWMFVYLCVTKDHHFLKLYQGEVWDVFQDVWKTFSQIKNAVWLQEIIFVFICNLNPRDLQKNKHFLKQRNPEKISKKSNFLVEGPLCLFVMFDTS